MTVTRSSCLLLAFALGLGAQKQPFDVQALMKIARISEPQLSPDGKTVAFTVQSINLDQNTKPKQIYTVPVLGGAPRQITTQGDDNERPQWSPDSKRIAFISNRGGSAQVWTMNADGSEPKQITNISTEAGGVLFSPDGKKLVFTSDVYADCADDACNQARLDAEKNSKVKARSYTTLLYRHWTDWQRKRRSHLMVVDAEGGAVKDLTPGDRDVPPFSLGGPDDYAISPDSKEVCYSMNADPVTAISTNSDLFVVPIGGGDSTKITINAGADASPQYSRDGRWLAYRSQARAGYESDRWRLMVLERATGKVNSVTEALDRSVESFTWSPDSNALFYTVIDRGRQSIQMIPAAGGASRIIVSGPHTFDDMQFSSDGKTMIYSGQSGSAPTELYRASSSGGTSSALTHLNDALLSGYALTPLEEFWVESSDKARVQSFLVKPPNFIASRKYPVLMLIHGGPEGEWGESWTYRWNAQVFAAAGFVVVMPNPRGSFGYGQKFTEDIKDDWGGKPYDDIMAVTDYTAALPYADSNRMAAAGGSYGGYMIDWILGHTQRFKALISHAGVYDLRSEFGATEELWFPLWEFSGTPWDNPDSYAKWSPSYYVKDFHTPTLVIHGEQDFRVPYTQGLQLFTALQIQKVPSKLLEFPDEGHWILKPQNSVLWYNSFLDWIGEWTKPVSSAN
ncbi:MAG TPA: S9 family peptidase [Bryobacteraceae bacterium]|nr:S9 family peptidase [Bryobacteraceae bacterium]